MLAARIHKNARMNAVPLVDLPGTRTPAPAPESTGETPTVMVDMSKGQLSLA